MNELSVSESKVAAGRGVLATMVGVGSDVVDSMWTGVFSVAKTARGEAFAATVTAVDWTEMLTRSAFKVVREGIARVDGSSRAVLDGFEAIVATLARAARASGESVSDVVSRTSASLVGEDARRAA
jgi:hypothetical protein